MNIYDQAPRECRGGPYHHLGIQTDDLDALIKHMQRRGFQFRGDIKDFGTGRYMMVMAPGNILLELFETVSAAASKNLRQAFDMDMP